MLRRSTLLIVGTTLTAALAPPSTGSARSRRPEFGPAQGVQATASGTTVDFRFTGASAAFGKALAGQPVAVTCARHSARALDALALADNSPALDDDARPGATGLPPSITANGSGLHVTLQVGTPGDVCTVSELVPADEPSRIGREANAAITTAGATWIDERQRATAMLDLLVASAPSTTYATIGQMVALGDGDVVALPGPDATPPPGKIGWWSQGRAMALVTLSAAGRRLLIQDLGGGMLRTNVLDALIAWSPFAPTRTAATTTARAGKQDFLPRSFLFPGDGLTGRRLTGRRGVVLRWSGTAAKVYRRLAGHRVRLQCTAALPPALLGEQPPKQRFSAETVRVPRHRGVLHAPAITGPRDVCLVVGDKTTGVVALTLRGWRSLAGLLSVFSFDAPFPNGLAPANATAYPSATAIAAAHPGTIALASPGQVVPPRHIGVWTDNGRQALYAANFPGGKRFVIQDEGDGTIRTNAGTTAMLQDDTGQEQAAQVTALR
jgi:hypothetical protein